MSTVELHRTFHLREAMTVMVQLLLIVYRMPASERDKFLELVLRTLDPKALEAAKTSDPKAVLNLFTRLSTRAKGD